MPSVRRPSTAGASPSSTQSVALTDSGPYIHPPQTLQKRHSAHNLASLEVQTSTVQIPPRPPRNPARTGTGERIVQKPKRPSTATGAREKPIQWEATPATASTSAMFPTAPITRERKPSTTTDTRRSEILPWEYAATGKIEDVLPWEVDGDLTPTPTPSTTTSPVVNGVHPHPRQSRSSISSSIQDMALLRRRKSTGTKALPPLSYTNGASSRVAAAGSTPTKVHSSSPKVLHKTPSASTVRPPLPKVSSGPVPTISSLEHSPAPTSSPAIPQASPHSPEEPGTSQDPKFSTADRTILKELKRNISVRAAQFVIKGGPAESGRTVNAAHFDRRGAKHHTFSSDEVPYPRSYAREVLDLDIWETMACQTICDSLTWHVFATPPSRVLDIGCGTGTWILNCGKTWRKSHFVGLDIVPLHPNLGSAELASRVTWVQANFLEGLPFPNDEFDFVHIKRIALGVPEDKWDGLFEEIARVLRPGGAFELIEEDLFFPGKLSDDDSDSESDTVSQMRYARDPEMSEDDDSILTTSGGSRKSYETPNTSLGAIPPTPPRTSSPLPMSGLQQDIIEETNEEDTPPRSNKLFPASSPAHPSHRHSSYQSRIPSAPTSSSRTNTHSTASLAPSSSLTADRRGKPRGYSTSTLVSPSNQHPSILSSHSSNSHISSPPNSKPLVSPFLLRTVPKPPPNPRDHSLLEKIYNEMNATRFINLSPLSLLANLVGLYFKDVRTHPPLQMTFPPPALPHLEEENSSESESDSDDARNALVPRPSRRQSAISIVASSPRSTTFSDALALSEEHRWVHTSELVKRESRYISLDESRMSGYSPSARASFPAMSPIKSTTDLPVLELPEASSAGPHARASANRAPVSAGSRNRLPNQTLNIDMRSLNMHLALRTAEVIACSESMWEWVTKYQKEVVAQRAAGRPRAGSLASELTPRSSRPPVLPPDPELDAFKNAILELTREDFDALLVKFDLDMRDHMAIASTLRDHFSWPCIPLAPSAERKAFNAACERWEQWQEQQRRKVKLPFSHARASVDEDRNGHGNAKRDRRRSSSTTSSSAVAPDRKLSRSIRVFAAWKA